ncbi:MAG: Gfo/Idh/MocA family oxidoreductase [Opitutaceae bacterium]|nr:Gfo/Idh/MocA family oxidoreductase [Opitutaceae bacterium]
MKSATFSRRGFVRRCAALAAASGLPLWFVERQLAAAEAPAPKKPAPNDRPGFALIGCGGQGTGDSRNAANWGDLVAVCDVDAKRAAETAAKLTPEGKPAPKIYSDFRRVLERPDVHALVNGTPDHWHTLVNLGAARAKKDVYAEKPLTLTIDEGRRLVREVQQSGIVLQTGTQQRSSQRFRLACELVRNTRIGKLLSADVWLPAGLREGPFATAPVPEELNWDFWLGPAPFTAYVPQRCHRTFRFWFEYSGGTMTDWGAHHNDIAYWAIGLVAPREVSARVLADPIPGGYTTFSDYEVNYTYANGVRLNIHTTRDDNPNGGKVVADGQRNGIRFEGTHGWIWVNRDTIKASDPEILKAPLPEDAVKLPVSKNHMENFFDCVKSRQAPICDVETGHRSATMCHLGAIAMRTGRALTWDGDAERFTGAHAAEGNAHLARELRAPYDYSFVG